MTCQECSVNTTNFNYLYFRIKIPTDSKMSEISELTQILIEFRNARDWEQFHDSKNLAAALMIEAAEVNELFLWKDVKQADSHVNIERLGEELADVLAYEFMLAARHKLDVKQIMLDKIEKNGKKYPVEKAKGNATKWDEL